MPGLTLYDKLVQSHVVETLDEEHVLLYVDLHIMNEYTSPQAFSGLAARGRQVLRPGQQMAVVDHVIPTHPVPSEARVIAQPDAALQARNLKRNCDSQGIALFDTRDPLQGIEHVIAPEHGMILPGMVVLCGDSHTTTYGALGALGFGIGTSEVEHILATQTLVYRLARTMRIRIDGELGAGVSAKDLVIFLVHRLGAQGARGYAVELCGGTIAALSAEGRMTVCNMMVEAGARAALIAPDAITEAYVREHAPQLRPHWQAARAHWATLRSDEDACFDVEHGFDAREIAPYVTWGTSPDQAVPVDAPVPSLDGLDALAREAAVQALAYIGLRPRAPGGPADRPGFHRLMHQCAHRGPARGGRGGAGRRVAPGVRAMVVPGSGAVRDQAEAEGLARILIEAGFEWRQPGCSMCLAMNDDVLRPAERCASTTNRNFEGRQGRGGRTHLMSPAMAAAAALAGHIVDIRQEIRA